MPALRHWRAVEQNRKNGLKLIASFGPVLLLRALTRTIGLHDGLKKVGHKMGLGAKAIVLDAEAPIDVDKIQDFTLVEKILAERAIRGPDAPTFATSAVGKGGIDAWSMPSVRSAREVQNS